MKIEVLIPNYNGFELISKNLKFVAEAMSSFKDSKITIIDDFSSDREQENLENFINEFNKTSKTTVKLLKNKKNYGFASAVDNGAFASNADLLVLLNTDVVPEKNFLIPILNHFVSNEKLFGVGCMDKSIENNKIILRGRGLGSFKKGIVQHSKGDVGNSSTFWISGGSCVVKREIFIKLGGFDTIYNPFYWEDIDLSYRAVKSGYDILFEKESVVEHRHSEGSIKKHYSDKKIKTVAYRNQFIFLWKNITDINLIYSHMLWLPYHVLTAILRGDLAFINGFLLAVVYFPAIILRRARQKKMYVRKDRDLFI